MCVTAEVIASDLAAPGAPAKLIAEIAKRGLTVDTLINNAGFGARGAFAEIDRAEQARMIDLNCRALMELCHVVLPGMIERGSGSILNVASTAAFQPGPWMSVYYATKAFVLSFSEGLHEEVKVQGIHVSALCAPARPAPNSPTSPAWPTARYSRCSPATPTPWSRTGCAR